MDVFDNLFFYLDLLAEKAAQGEHRRDALLLLNAAKEDLRRNIKDVAVEIIADYGSKQTLVKHLLERYFSTTLTTSLLTKFN